MTPKLTSNKSSTQLIIPKAMCNAYGFKTGYEVLLEERPDGLLIKKPCLANDARRIWTIGYEKRRPDDFLAVLRRNRILQIIDVREVPFSRKPGFSGKALQEMCSKNGIMYHHVKELGSPTEARKELKEGGSFDRFADRFLEHLSRNQQSLSFVEGLATSVPSVLLCFELEHDSCHRSLIAERMTGNGFSVVHL